MNSTGERPRIQTDGLTFVHYTLVLSYSVSDLMNKIPPD
jgi:hypothetical protein